MFTMRGSRELLEVTEGTVRYLKVPSLQLPTHRHFVTMLPASVHAVVILLVGCAVRTTLRPSLGFGIEQQQAFAVPAISRNLSSWTLLLATDAGFELRTKQQASGSCEQLGDS